MNDPRRKNPTFGLGLFIVVVVLIVIGTVLFNAIRGKRDYDASHARQPAEAASATVAPASAAAASQ